MRAAYDENVAKVVSPKVEYAGALVQSGERLICIQEVASSNLARSNLGSMITLI